MSKPRIDYIDGFLQISHLRSHRASVDPSAIVYIHECRMEDPSQGDEEFHILLQADQFWIIGPFIDGALGAINALRQSHPKIPIRCMIVHYLPWKLRAPGFWGLRLFPVAGLGVFPLKKLPPHYVCGG